MSYVGHSGGRRLLILGPDRVLDNCSEISTGYASRLTARFGDLTTLGPTDVPGFVTGLLEEARSAGASDIHIVPQADSVQLLWRVDGVLHGVGRCSRAIAPNMIARLKVLAELLSYQTEVPQEGRLRETPQGEEMRLSTFPTLYGEKGVVRIFAESRRLTSLHDLGFLDRVTGEVERLLHATGGVFLVAGPAGSGKTTTLYGCLRHLLAESGQQRSLVSLEDPIEVAVEGVAQSQIKPGAGFTYDVGLRSLMRQDPEVIMVGEIRDRATAEMVFQASLTGHLVLTTFHAGSAAEAVSRLYDMGIEPYLLRTSLLGILFQRLVRTLCPCSEPIETSEERLGFDDVSAARRANGCPECDGLGYRGRTTIAELLLPDRKHTSRAILQHGDSEEIEQAAIAAGMQTRWDCARALLDAGVTSPVEVRRVLGF